MTAPFQTPDGAPHSPEAEQGLLGCLLLSPNRIHEVESAGGADLFHDEGHAYLFKRMRDKNASGHLVSPVAMGSEDVVEVFKNAGGKRYLVSLTGLAMPSAFEGYIEVLTETKARRDLLAIVTDAASAIRRGEESPSIIAGRVEAASQGLSTLAPAERPVSMTKAATEALREAADAYHGNPPPLVPSGLMSLDSMIGGFGPGEMCLLGGRPSMGKTGVALSIALNAARRGTPVVFASLEMTPKSLALRALSEGASESGVVVPYSDARRGQMSEEQFEALTEATRRVAQLPIKFLPKRYAEPSLLFSGVRQSLSGWETDKMPLVIVDYLQLMRGDARTRTEEITKISIAVKDVAMRLECPLIALSQLSRAVESRDEKRPMLSDLRESGQLEQDADQILFCYRDEYYLRWAEPQLSDVEAYADWQAAMSAAHNKLEIIVAKQRQGETGTAHMRFNPATNAVWE